MRTRKLTSWSQIVLLLWCTSLQAAPLFEDDSLLELELRGPLRETLKDRRERNERPFQLAIDGGVLDVDVRVRGNSRVELCDFPPLRLDLARADTAGTVFSGQTALKLVTHCKKPGAYEENLIEEYAAYRIFSLLSEHALNVRLVRIRYVDTSRPGREPLVRHAFAIESLEAFAERVGGEEVRVQGIARSRLDVEHIATVFVFQYLIGNTDWSLVTARGDEFCCHNGELLDKDGRLYFIPYDFDFAGLVNAKYAKPQPEMGIRTVRKRRYRGYCIDNLDLGVAIRRAVEASPAIIELLRGLPDADGDAGADRIRYVERFVEEARDVDGLARKFERACIG